MLQESVARRVAALRGWLAGEGLDGALFTSGENRRYFCGFTGDAGALLVTATQAALITDPRFTTQAKQELVSAALIEQPVGKDRLGVVASAVLDCGVRRLAMEGSCPAADYATLRTKLGGVEIRVEQMRFLAMRAIKDEGELAAIRGAIAIAEAGFDRLIPQLRIGMTENDLAAELAYLVAREGAEGPAFSTIVGAGPRGALPHGAPTGRLIQNGDLVVVDFGVYKDGYCSDMTRTLFFGDVSAEGRRVFELVCGAQDTAMAAIRPGVPARDVDAAHREFFRQHGCEERVMHGLGHGIGLQVHEEPRLAVTSEAILAPGMVVTVEPGLYYPDVFGVRTEDNVLVTQTGYENLSRTRREIHIG